MPDSTFFSNADIFFFTKLLFLIVLGLYALFTFVIFTQVTRMNGIIKPTSSVFLQFLALLQVLFAISLFIAALAIL